MQLSKNLQLRSLWRKAWQGFGGHVSVLVIANLISVALSFVQGVIVARILGPVSYGIVALIMTYPDFLFGLLNPQTADVSVKYLGQFYARGEEDRALAMCKLGYTIDFGIALLAFGVIAVSAWWAAGSVVHHPSSAGLIVLYAAAFLPRAMVGTSRAVFAVFDRFSLLAWLSLLSSVARTGMIVGFVLAGWGITGVIWGNVLSSTFYGIALGVLAYRFVIKTWGKSWMTISLRALEDERRGIVRFLFFNDVNLFVGIFFKQFDYLLLGYFRGPQEVGYYRLAKSLAGFVGNLVSPLQSVTYPRLSRLKGSDKQEEMQAFIRRLALWVGFPLGILSLLGLILIPWIIQILVGEAFAPAIPATLLLFVGSGIWLVLFWLRPYFMAQDEIHRWASISTLIAGSSFLAYWIIIPQWGYLGLSAWQATAIVVAHGLAFMMFRKMHAYGK